MLVWNSGDDNYPFEDKVCEEQQAPTADMSCSITVKAVVFWAVGCLTWKRRIRGHRWSERRKTLSCDWEEGLRHEGDVRKSGAKTNALALIPRTPFHVSLVLERVKEGRRWQVQSEPLWTWQASEAEHLEEAFSSKSSVRARVHVLDALLGYKKDLYFHSIVTVFCIFSSKEVVTMQDTMIQAGNLPKYWPSRSKLCAWEPSRELSFKAMG